MACINNGDVGGGPYAAAAAATAAAADGEIAEAEGRAPGGIPN